MFSSFPLGKGHSEGHYYYYSVGLNGPLQCGPLQEGGDGG